MSIRAIHPTIWDKETGDLVEFGVDLDDGRHFTIKAEDIPIPEHVPTGSRTDLQPYATLHLGEVDDSLIAAYLRREADRLDPPEQTMADPQEALRAFREAGHDRLQANPVLDAFRLLGLTTEMHVHDGIDLTVPTEHYAHLRRERTEPGHPAQESQPFVFESDYGKAKRYLYLPYVSTLRVRDADASQEYLTLALLLEMIVRTIKEIERKAEAVG